MDYPLVAMLKEKGTTWMWNKIYVQNPNVGKVKGRNILFAYPLFQILCQYSHDIEKEQKSMFLKIEYLVSWNSW